MVVGGDDLPQRKPHPMGILYACEQWNLQPNQVLMVGDSKNDILAGKSAEVATLGLSYGYNYGEPIADSKPDATSANFDEILTILEGK